MSKPDDAASAAATQETTTAERKPDGELDAKGGESGGGAQDTGGLEKSYKELQSKFSKTTESNKALQAQIETLNQYGGLDKIVEQIEYLAGNESFKKWAESEQKKEYGVDTENLDSETHEALKLVEKIADATTDKKLQKALADLEARMMEKISPVSTGYMAERMDRLLDGLDDKYGDSWHEVRESLADIIENDKSFPKMPTAENVEESLMIALKREGKLNEFIQKLNQRELDKKKELATETPGTRKDAAPETKFKTIQEAYEAAKRQHA